MGIKLIAIDLDDTLLNDECRISPRNQQAVAEAVKRGVTVTVSTGRMYCSALPFAKELKLDVPLIVYNGAMIKTSYSEELIFHQPVAEAAAEEIFALAQKNNWYIQTYIDDKLYVSELNGYAKRYSKIASVEAHLIDDLFNLPGASTKIMIQAEAAEIPAISAGLQAKFSGKLSLTISKPTFLEITDLGVNKGTALAMLAERLGIEREAIMAFGDSGNDVEMLKFAQHSFAMANGTDLAKRAARYQTATNNEDGVALAIEKYVLS
ncbi:MAG: Cof-type HAD-IIB family hydrolase [Sporomusaceae bacterium]|nr:Cof-type HAD-IIB family hydrolase [Sporomusaceae bacterium]